MSFEVSSIFVRVCVFIMICNAAEQTLNNEKTENRLGELERKVAVANERYKELEEKLMVYTKINSKVLAELKIEREQSIKKDYVIESMKNQLNNVQEKVDAYASHLPKNEPVLVGNTNDDNAPENDNAYEIKDRYKGTAIHNRPGRFALDQGEAVAFHAVVDANGEVRHQGVNQNIVFETVLLNINGGYNSQHGIFTAPTAGLYMFSTSVLDAGSKPLIHADLVKNGVVLARAYGHGNGGYPEQGSVTVFSQLKAGDQIWVRLSCCADGSITGLRYTSFTGGLIMYI